MGVKTVYDSSLSAVADAIRAKTGKSDSMEFPDEFVSEIGSISGGGGNDTLKEVLDQTITSYSYSGTRTITRLFESCTSLTSASFSNVLTVEQYMFYSCSGLTSVNLDSATTINDYALMRCKKLELLKLPKVTTVKTYAFSEVGRDTSNGAVIVLPLIQTMETDVFRACNLAAVDIGPDLSLIQNRCFYSTGAQDYYGDIILRRSSGIVALNKANGMGVPSNKHTTIYVPQALIPTYQTATNWSTVLSNSYITMTAIEGSQYETHYADGTVIPT